MINNALYNILIGYIKIFIFTIASFYITKILLKYLGTDLYGVTILFSSFNQYIGLIVIVITASVSRFVSFEYFKDEFNEANEYYSTAFYSLVIGSIVIFILLFLLSFYLNNIFNLPLEYLQDIQFFFLLSIFSFLLMSIYSIFNVGMTIKHTFYINDIINIFSKSIQLLTLIFLIYIFHSISLFGYALSIILFSICSLFLAYMISKRIIELDIKVSYFNILKLKDMSKMGFASLFNNLGMLLYTSSDIIIINILLGSSYVGNYGIALQMSFLIPMVGSSFSRIFTPYIVELISKDRRIKLIDNIKSYSHIFSIFIGLIFSILVVFSSTILYFWLGKEFEHLYLLIILLSIYQLLHQSTVLSFTYITMMNKLKLPSIVTFVAGIINVILSIVLIKYTILGIYGAVIATIITVFFKTVIFNVVYAAYLLKINPLILWTPIIKGLSLPLLYSCITYLYISSLLISSIWMLLGVIFIFSVIYLFLAYFIVFSKKDRIKFILLFKLKKISRLL